MVKLFKAKRGSDEIIELVGVLDKDPKWYAASSSWSFLEVARALRKDRKTRELVDWTSGSFGVTRSVFYL